MTSTPESSPSGESKNKRVFDIFDRASSHEGDTSFQYFIGDGIVIRVGWVDNGKDDPDLTLELRDEKFYNGVGLIVDQSVARYIRQTQPLLSTTEWLLADKQTRRLARQAHRAEWFSTPTASLEPIAQAVCNHDPHTGPEPLDSEVLFESSLSVVPQPSTDIEYIRELINAFSEPLD